MLQVVKSTFIGKLILKYITKKFYATVGGEPQRVRIERRKWGPLECRSTLGGGAS